MLRKLLGDRGEGVAEKFLRRKGFIILEENYATKCGEIDLIARDKKTIVFIEVRSKSSCQYGHPAETIDEKKQKKIRRTAQHYLISKNLEGAYCRFDVITVIWSSQCPYIEYLMDAF